MESFELDELFFSGVSYVCFLLSAPTVGGIIVVGFLITGLCFEVGAAGASAISTSEPDPELDEPTSELLDFSLPSSLDSADRDAGFRNLTGAFGISSSSELEPIFPVSPSPKPEGLKRIFKPFGCCRTGFLAGTVACDAVLSSFILGNLTTC